MMKSVDLQEWANDNEPSKDMHYYNGYWDQIMFIRDRITSMIFGSRSEGEKFRVVISHHFSKSVRLPVYRFEIKELQLSLILRCNFHDWKVSVQSEKPITCDFGNLIDGSQKWTHHYCEGFKDEWIFDSFNKNNQKFTIELYDDFKLYTFIWLLIQHLKKES